MPVWGLDGTVFVFFVSYSKRETPEDRSDDMLVGCFVLPSSVVSGRIRSQMHVG